MGKLAPGGYAGNAHKKRLRLTLQLQVEDRDGLGAVFQVVVVNCQHWDAVNQCDALLDCSTNRDESGPLS